MSMKLLATFVLLTFLPSAQSSQLHTGAISLETQQIWSVLTNSFAQDPIYQWEEPNSAELPTERQRPQINMVGKIQMVSSRVVLPADFEYDPN